MEEKPSWVKRIRLSFDFRYVKGRADERLEIMKLLRDQDQAWAEYAIGVIVDKGQLK
jgi:hypothetical protein